MRTYDLRHKVIGEAIKEERLQMLLDHDIALKQKEDLLRRAANLLRQVYDDVLAGDDWLKDRDQWLKDAGVEQ